MMIDRSSKSVCSDSAKNHNNASRNLRKQLLGFGWTGRTACVIGVLLLITHLAGVDIFRAWLLLLAKMFGTYGVDYYINGIHYWHSTKLLHPVFSLVTLASVLIAMQIHPARFHVLWYITAFMLTLITPMTWAWEKYLFNPIMQMFQNMNAWQVLGSPLVNLLTLLPMGIFLVLLTRSRLVAIVITISLIAEFILYYWDYYGATTLFSSGIPWPLGENEFRGLFWHASIIGVLLWWGIHARKDSRRLEGYCKICGYNLRGDFESGCPECGWNRGVQQ